MRRGGGLALGGGGLGVAGVVIYLLFTLLSSAAVGWASLAPLDDRSVGPGDTPGEISQDCRTGADANQRQDCRIVAVVNSVQKFWDGVFRRSGKRYPYVDTVFFTDQVQTGCGVAELAGRPVLLPRRQAGLHRPRLLRRAAVALRRRRGAVRAGLRDRARVRPPRPGPARGPDSDPQRPPGAESKAVRSELQADCYAGVWAAHAVETGLIEQLTQDDINEGLDAAAAIGDDRIQEQTQGQVNPETWTHGSSEQRRRWFSRGYENGKPAACDTFSGSI